eukprot:6457433-Amphidinium_carterae.1
MLQRHGQYWIPSRRFVIQQGWTEAQVDGTLKKVPKFRCIDDFTESGINNAAVLKERISPKGVDGVAGLVKTWLSVISGDR